MVQQVVTFLYLIYDEFVANKKDVGQTSRLVNVAKGLPCLHRSFTMFDVRKLSVKLRLMMDMTMLTHLWCSFNTLGFTLDTSTMYQRSMDANNILILNFQRLKFPSLNLSIILAASLSNDAIVRSDILLKHSN